MIFVALGFIINEVGWAGFIGKFSFSQCLNRCYPRIYWYVYKFLDSEKNAIKKKKYTIILR